VTSRKAVALSEINLLDIKSQMLGFFHSAITPKLLPMIMTLGNS
jgi:hypothetical protein